MLDWVLNYYKADEYIDYTYVCLYLSEKCLYGMKDVIFKFEVHWKPLHYHKYLMLPTL